MRRRDTLKLAAAAGAAAMISEGAMAEPIQLHVDLEVDPSKETNLVKTFKDVFRPVISRQPGFVEVRLLKSATRPTQWRLLISFQTEAQRKTWVATDEHQRVWPEMEKNLTGKKFTTVLFDVQ
jgi:heme-degrading monooxygenase HmoA